MRFKRLVKDLKAYENHFGNMEACMYQMEEIDLAMDSEQNRLFKNTSLAMPTQQQKDFFVSLNLFNKDVGN